MVLHVAAGREYRGRRVERQLVVFVALEGHSGIHNRVIAAARHLGIEDAPFGVIKAVESFRNPDTAARVAATAKAIREQYGADGEAFDNPVIVIDTFQAALGPGGSDCRPEDVSELIENVKKLLIVPGMTVCYVLRAMQLGENPYGEPVTGVYVEHRADSGKGKRGGNRIGPKSRAAYETLWAIVKDRSQSQPLDGGPLRCVLLHQRRDACCQPGVLGQIKDAANRCKKFYAARDELLEKAMIIVDCQDGHGDDYNARVYPSREGE
jgi:hypothetical protein